MSQQDRHPQSGRCVLHFDQIRKEDLPRVGGKGANLGEMAAAGFPVPGGFCVTTEAYLHFLRPSPELDHHFLQLDRLIPDDVEAARVAALAMREFLATLPLPSEVEVAVVALWSQLGEEGAYAVRSSATAEDLPTASFAGQQDTYLNIQGRAPLLDAIKRCWISLFTDRAVLYRARSGFGHRKVLLSVVVQKMVLPEVSGILFTADPVGGRRDIASIDAGFGLGEALVGGLISADLYRVNKTTGEVVEARVGDKARAILPLKGGGTEEVVLPPARAGARVLSDVQLRELVDLGTRIEAHYGGIPQDIEWCLEGGRWFVVQARPITSLFPLPKKLPTDGLHVYLSFGHIQMMTDPMPLAARQMWRWFIPAGKAFLTRVPTGDVAESRVFVDIASRLFLDVTSILRVPRIRDGVLGVLNHIYRDVAVAVGILAKRKEIASIRDSFMEMLQIVIHILGPTWKRLPGRLLWNDPSHDAEWANAWIHQRNQEAQTWLKGAGDLRARLKISRGLLASIFTHVDPLLARVMSGLISHKLLETAVARPWGAEVRGEVEKMLRGLPGNVTTEMDLRVGDLADLARPHPALCTLIDARDHQRLRREGGQLPGGEAFLKALDQFLEEFGIRGASEIDVSRIRWSEDPSLLLAVVSGSLKGGEMGGHRRRHTTQRLEGEAAAARIVEASGRGLLGPLRKWWITRLTRLMRNGLGLREHPKFMLISEIGRGRKLWLEAGDELVRRGQLRRREDVFHLSYEEVDAALADGGIHLEERVTTRKEELEQDRKRTPPLAMASDGEIPRMEVDLSQLPPHTWPGTAASAGVVEGIARVVLDPSREVLHSGEILVAPFTDPGWTPLFVHAGGLVTEIGGMMTHGSVVAREYGIPAVVSVRQATTRIHTGDRIRVDGSRGLVTMLTREGEAA